MKKVTKLIGLAALTASLAISTPAVAQTPENSTTTTADMDDDDDDGDKWGLAGLLGLLGLLGLRRRDDDHHRPTTPNR